MFQNQIWRYFRQLSHRFYPIRLKSWASVKKKGSENGGKNTMWPVSFSWRYEPATRGRARENQLPLYSRCSQQYCPKFHPRLRDTVWVRSSFRFRSLPVFVGYVYCLFGLWLRNTPSIVTLDKTFSGEWCFRNVAFLPTWYPDFRCPCENNVLWPASDWKTISSTGYTTVVEGDMTVPQGENRHDWLLFRFFFAICNSVSFNAIFCAGVL